MAQTIFIDVSKYQPDPSIIETAYNGGARGIIIQISNGANGRNPYADTQKEKAESLGMTVGYYHYQTNDIGEADNFIDALKDLDASNTALVVLDAEEQLSATYNVQQFQQALATANYANFGVYSSSSIFASKQIDYTQFKKVWAASYGAAPTIPYNAWQYTETFLGLNLDASYDDGTFLMDGKDTGKVNFKVPDHIKKINYKLPRPHKLVIKSIINH